MTAELEDPNFVDQETMAALDEHPFSSVREAAKRTYVLPTTIWQSLINSIGCVVKHLYWVPYKLNDGQLATRAPNI
jgi:hypothetical protein